MYVCECVNMYVYIYIVSQRDAYRLAKLSGFCDLLFQHSPIARVVRCVPHQLSFVFRMVQNQNIYILYKYIIMYIYICIYIYKWKEK